MLRVRVTVGLSGDNARKEGPGQRSILTSLSLPLHASMQGPEGQGPALDRQSKKKSGRDQRANRTKAGLRYRPDVLGSPPHCFPVVFEFSCCYIKSVSHS